MTHRLIHQQHFAMQLVGTYIIKITLKSVDTYRYGLQSHRYLKTSTA